MKFLRNTLFIRWSASFIIATLLFGLGQPAFAQILEQDINLAQYLTTNSVEVGSETINGYQQVYYIYNGFKVFITNSNQNSTQAVSDREYIAFSTVVNGAGQIFLYHIPSDTTVQITSSSTNLQPRLSNGKIVWERWVENKWQVFFFDGVSVHQLTSGSLSINPDIEDNKIIYASNNEQDEWRTIEYSLDSKQAVVKKNGLVARYPKFINKQIVFELEELIIEQEAKAERLAEEIALAEQDSLEEIPIEPTPLPVIDTTPPVITLNGEAIINLVLGDTYAEEGAIAIDDVNGVVPVIINGYIDTSLLGVYIIHYNTTDSSNNNAEEVLRTINIIDPNAPISEPDPIEEPKLILEPIPIPIPILIPTPEPVVELEITPEPTPEPAPVEESTPEPVVESEPTPEPVVEPEITPEPTPEPILEPETVVEEDIITELEGKPLIEEEVVPTKEEPLLIDELETEPISIPESTPTEEPVIESAPIVEPQPEVDQPLNETLIEPIPEPISESGSELEPEPVSEPEPSLPPPEA